MTRAPIYLASPYSDKSQRVQAQRYFDVSRCAAHLIMQGIPVFSPIVHNHHLAHEYAMPTSALAWDIYNRAFLNTCGALYVCCIDGWKESVGVTAEIEYALGHGIPLTFVTPEGLPAKGPV